jgi:hypothetical protein
MIIDNLLVLGDAQAVTTSAATTNIIDTLAAGNAIAPGALFQFLIDTAVTSSGAVSVTFDIQTATDSAFTTPVTLSSSGAIAKASLVAGYVPLNVVIPTGCLEFLRGYYTLTATANGGKIDARIVTAGGNDVTLDKVL